MAHRRGLHTGGVSRTIAMMQGPHRPTAGNPISGKSKPKPAVAARIAMAAAQQAVEDATRHSEAARDAAAVDPADPVAVAAFAKAREAIKVARAKIRSALSLVKAVVPEDADADADAAAAAAVS